MYFDFVAAAGICVLQTRLVSEVIISGWEYSLSIHHFLVPVHTLDQLKKPSWKYCLRANARISWGGVAQWLERWAVDLTTGVRSSIGVEHYSVLLHVQMEYDGLSCQCVTVSTQEKCCGTRKAVENRTIQGRHEYTYRHHYPLSLDAVWWVKGRVASSLIGQSAR